MNIKSYTSLIDFLGMSFFGLLTGAIYGVILWFATFCFIEVSHPSIIVWSAIVFGILGLIFGNFILAAFLALIYFIWGLFNGFADNWFMTEYRNIENYLQNFFLVGLGTGLVLTLWLYY